MNMRTIILATALSACFGGLTLNAQTPNPTPPKENPFRAGEAAPRPAGVPAAGDPFGAPSGGEADNFVRLIDIQWEAFSMPLTDAHLFLRKFKTDAERYDEIVRRADAGEAKLELLHRVRTRSGQRAKVDAIDEKIYPTDFVEQPTSKATKEPPKDAPPADAAPVKDKAVVPQAFETRNVGATLEVEPTLAEDGVTVDVTVAPQITSYLGDDAYQSGTTQPRFQSQTLTTYFAAKAGQAVLIGTQSPPNGTGVWGATPEKVVWFSFMKVEVVTVK